MSLTVLTSDPYDGQINVTLDKVITITFSQAIDPFTVQRGVALYNMAGQNWVGPGMALLDNKKVDKSNIDNVNQYIDFTYTLESNNTILKLTPSISLDEETQYYIQIFPGNDTSRFVSSTTVDSPIYTRDAVTPSAGIVEIVSSYSAKTNGTYLISITSPTTADVLFNGSFKESITFVDNVPKLINKNISLSFVGAFAVNDTISIDVFKASGLTGIFKESFTTSSYVTATAQSSRIEDTLYQLSTGAFRIVSTFPQDQSINNPNVNPITIKFNKSIDTTQNIQQKIVITKKDMDTDIIKKVNYFYVINPANPDTIKIYLDSVDNSPLVYKEDNL